MLIERHAVPVSDLPLPSTGRGNEGEGCSHPRLPTSRWNLGIERYQTAASLNSSRAPWTFPPLTPALSPLRGEGVGSACLRGNRSTRLAALAPALDLPLPSKGRGNEGEGCSHPQLPTSQRTLEKVLARTTTSLQSSHASPAFSPLTPTLSPLRGEGDESACLS